MDRITLETKKVSIEFPGVKALSDVDFAITTGEIRAVVGANGAGKSTLMKVLAGANPDYTGEVLLNGQAVELRTPTAAKKIGIQIVYQEVDTALVPTLSVGENVMLNQTVMSRGKPFMNWPSIHQQAREVLKRLNITNINVRTLVQDLSLAQKQMVLIARAIQSQCSVLILDEPTSALDPVSEYEVYSSFNEIAGDKTTIYISHRLASCRFCDKIAVFDSGGIVQTGSHGTLISDEGGIYHALWHAQAQYYTEEAGAYTA